jgi:hypothetical protein
VRAGLRTSPLGVSADSMPRKANIRSTVVRATSPPAGIPGQARFSALMANIPTPTRIRSGVSLAAVTVCTTLLPILMPRMLIAAKAT